VVSLAFYGGVNEIGENKDLLEDGNVKVFLDFDQPFNMGCDFLRVGCLLEVSTG
jgi:hypothetical protein